MKHTVCLFLALCLTFALFACGKNDGDQTPTEQSAPVTRAYDPETDGEAGELEVIFFGEDVDRHGLSVWSRSAITDHKDDSAPETASIVLMGKTFEGTYESSAVYYPATHLSHYYKTDFGGFSVNAETGAIDSFHASYAETEKTLSLEQCRSRADAVAETFVDLSQYEVDVMEDETSNYFTYTKRVEGLETNDKLGVGISIYGGGITALGASLVGSFEVTDDAASAVRRLKSADADSAIKEKVDARFEGEYTMGRDDFSVIFLPDGTLALMTQIEVSTTRSDVADGETYFYPHTSAYDAFVFEK